MMPVTIRMPQPSPPRSESVFIQFEQEEMTFCIPSDITQMMQEEKTQIQNGTAQITAERDSLWRQIYNAIPQPEKPGPDGVTAQYTSSAILTEDLLVGYFDQVRDAQGQMQDVLHIVLVWSMGGQGSDAGWVLPGKRDRSYDSARGDISIQDANESLVQKEIGVGRGDIAYHQVLAFFDDRKREERFKSSGVVGFVLLHSRPTLVPGRRIGIPLNGLKLLAERRIRIPERPGGNELYGLTRQHDSILLQVFKTAKFYHTMEKLKMAQIQWRELLRQNPQAARPALAAIDPGQECPVCFDLMVGAHVVCTEGHSLCEVCLPVIQAAGRAATCPTCRTLLLERPIRNLALDQLIQTLNPEGYERIHREIHGAAPASWQEHPAFCGDAITYRA